VERKREYLERAFELPDATARLALALFILETGGREYLEAFGGSAQIDALVASWRLFSSFGPRRSALPSRTVTLCGRW